MTSIFAILSTLASALSMIYKKVNTFCDENNMSYDITVHSGKTFNRSNFRQ